MAGKHRAGDPVDDVGTLAILDGLVVAVAAEADRRRHAAARSLVVNSLEGARDNLIAARRLILAARSDGVIAR